MGGEVGIKHFLGQSQNSEYIWPFQVGELNIFIDFKLGLSLAIYF